MTRKGSHIVAGHNAQIMRTSTECVNIHVNDICETMQITGITVGVLSPVTCLIGLNLQHLRCNISSQSAHLLGIWGSDSSPAVLLQDTFIRFCLSGIVNWPLFSGQRRNSSSDVNEHSSQFMIRTNKSKQTTSLMKWRVALCRTNQNNRCRTVSTDRSRRKVCNGR